MKCDKCALEKCEFEFYSNKSRKSGFDNYCKLCRKIQVSAATNKEKQNQYTRRYYEINKEKLKINAANRARKYRKTNKIFVLKERLRTRLNKAVKFGYKTGSAVKDLGCSVEEFMKFIEAKFKPGMTWENWGRKGWHLDHVVPLSKFDLTNLEQFKKAVHFTNLQPLWYYENLAKSNKVA